MAKLGAAVVGIGLFLAGIGALVGIPYVTGIGLAIAGIFAVADLVSEK